jgi:hypothetical protein
LHRESVEADRATPRDAASADGPAPHAGKSPLTEVFANAARHALAAEMATPARAGFIHSHSLGEDEMQDETKQEDPREKLQSVKRDYFPPSDLEKAQTAVGAVLEICQAVKIAPVYNFDVNADFPDGYGLAVLPIKSRDATRGNVVTGMAIVALPDPNTVAEHDKGADYIRAAVIDSFLAKAANAVRPRSDGSTAASVPYTVEDFIISRIQGTREGIRQSVEEERTVNYDTRNSSANPFERAIRGTAIPAHRKGKMVRIAGQDDCQSSGERPGCWNHGFLEANQRDG